MAEPTSSAAALMATTMGLTLFGMATGLHPEILLAGLAGGLWALSYQPPAPAWKRVAVTVMAAIIAGYLTPAIVAGATSIDVWPRAVTRELVQFPIAVLIGLLANRVLGPAIIRIVASKMKEEIK
jgi:4-hydroxybenzoate polyprenyltransferase